MRVKEGDIVGTKDGRYGKIKTIIYGTPRFFRRNPVSRVLIEEMDVTIESEGSTLFWAEGDEVASVR